MLADKLFTVLQNLINHKPTQQEVANALGIKQQVVGMRCKRNSNFSDEEIGKIEEYFGISINQNSNCVTIEHIHVNPSCGTGTILIDDADVTPVTIGKEVIKNLWNAKPENLKLFKATGDSMADTIEEGNVLLVDISKTDYHNGGIYILQINNDWYCKRLRLRMSGELDIISDNAKYPIETLKPETNIEIRVIGKVIKNLSRGL